MMKYVDFVICKHDGCEKKYLFYAPAFSHLDKGEMVTVDTARGEQMVTVVSSMTVEKTDKRAIDFIMESMNAPSEVKRVLSKVHFSKYDYEEEEE